MTSSRPTTLHDAINMARELVEQAVQGRAARISESNKRKWEDQQGNNHHQQQNQRQEAAKAYVAALTKGRGYAAKASSSQSWLWHQRLSHLNFATINNLVKNNLVQGLPKMKFEKDHLCSACEQGKIHRKHHKSKTAFASNKPLYLLHMDLCGPMRVQSINEKQYVLVVVDDYSRYTWVFFLHFKDKASEIMKSPTTNVESSNVKVSSHEKEVFHEISESFQGESSSSSLNDDVQLTPEEDHPLHKIIGDPKSSVRTRGQLANSCLFSCLLSSIEPANMAEALRDADWVSAMQEELDNFARLKVWRLVP
nr:retrovirus-related Pol polyprotein from transposon TNT 1-94 [Tanacetum cinerariifolium]